VAVILILYTKFNFSLQLKEFLSFDAVKFLLSGRTIKVKFFILN
jgi:hypothetical protein